MSIQKFDHHIQADIFAKLRHSKKLRYKDLKNPELEPSQFMYHLKNLMAQKLVEKTDDGYYQLAKKGVELAQHFSSALGNLNEAPLSYTLLFIRSEKGRWFVLRRNKQPHIGKLACISGKIRMDETLLQAAKREAKAFTGQSWEDKLQYRGFASILIRGATARTHITGPIWYIDGVNEVQLPKTPTGKGEWLDWKKQNYDEFIPGWKEIVELIESGEKNYLDLQYQL